MGAASFVWACLADRGGETAANAVVVSGNSLYMAGSYAGNAGLLFGNNYTPVITTGSGIQGFVAKLTDAGTTWNLVWCEHLGSAAGTGTALVANGNDLYAAGSFRASSSFGGTTLVAAGSNDAYVAKLTDSGTGATHVWAQRAGGTGDDTASALAINGTNVYVVGASRSTSADFGSTTLTNTALRTLYVAKLADSGTGELCLGAGHRRWKCSCSLCGFSSAEWQPDICDW